MLIPNILIWRFVSACRQTGACVESKNQILGEAGAVIGKAAAAFFSVMHRCMEFQVGCFYSVENLLPIEQTATLREGFQDMMFHDLVRASTPAMLSIQGGSKLCLEGHPATAPKSSQGRLLSAGCNHMGVSRSIRDISVQKCLSSGDAAESRI